MLGLNRWMLTQFTGCKMLDSAVRSAEPPRARLKTNAVFMFNGQLEAFENKASGFQIFGQGKSIYLAEEC